MRPRPGFRPYDMRRVVYWELFRLQRAAPPNFTAKSPTTTVRFKWTDCKLPPDICRHVGDRSHIAVSGGDRTIQYARYVRKYRYIHPSQIPAIHA